MNTYADEIRQRAETALRAALPAVASAMWRAYAEGQITEAEAETLVTLIEARQVFAKSGGNPDASRRGFGSPNRADQTNAEISGIASAEGIRISLMPSDRQRSPRTGTGSRPRTDASLERRRRWAASGRLPPALAARFSLAEQSALSIVAAETARRGDCRLSVPHLAAVAGVAETTVRNAIREARKLGLLTVEERRLTGFRNDTNVVRIVSPEWTAWLRLARKGAPRFGETPARRGIGCKFPNRTPTQVSEQGKTRPRQVPKSGIAVPISPPRSRSRNTGA